MVGFLSTRVNWSLLRWDNPNLNLVFRIGFFNNQIQAIQKHLRNPETPKKGSARVNLRFRAISQKLWSSTPPGAKTMSIMYLSSLDRWDGALVSGVKGVGCLGFLRIFSDWLVVSTHLKNMLLKLDHVPK